MKLSTQTKLLSRRFGYEEAIRLIARAGFDAFDLTLGRIQFAGGAEGYDSDLPFAGDGWRDYVLRLKKTTEEEHIHCNQAHAPWPSQIYGDAAYNERVFPLTVRAMECASLLGAPLIVVHPIKGCPEGVDEFAVNVDYFTRLLPYCQRYGIRIAIENMFIEDTKRGHLVSAMCGQGEEHTALCNALHSEWVVACLDIGHSGLAGDEAYRSIPLLGHRLKALHVHDNDYREDLHTLPYMGKVDWQRTLAALSALPYDGDFTFEADNCLKRLPDALLPQALDFLHTLGRHMMKGLEV